jgi:hypothetical protein
LRPLSPETAGKLFLAGGTVGPLVDSLHNQCLLTYGILSISIDAPWQDVNVSVNAISTHLNLNQYPMPILIATSWLIPPLLGVAYVVLGGILPRIVDRMIGVGVGVKIRSTSNKDNIDMVVIDTVTTARPQQAQKQTQTQLKKTAIAAVLSTALIIKLSAILETGHYFSTDQNLGIMMAAALAQWLALDRTFLALLLALITAIGGPLSELPFVAHDCWTYIPEAANYFPLHGIDVDIDVDIDNPLFNPLLATLLGESPSELALSSITGPCYFAVTTDAIALGRWFDADAMADDVDASVDNVGVDNVGVDVDNVGVDN